jgi:hypothetical protein
MGVLFYGFRTGRVKVQGQGIHNGPKAIEHLFNVQTLYRKYPYSIQSINFLRFNVEEQISWKLKKFGMLLPK